MWSASHSSRGRGRPYWQPQAYIVLTSDAPRRGRINFLLSSGPYISEWSCWHLMPESESFAVARVVQNLKLQTCVVWLTYGLSKCTLLFQPQRVNELEKRWSLKGNKDWEKLSESSMRIIYNYTQPVSSVEVGQSCFQMCEPLNIYFLPSCCFSGNHFRIYSRF